MDRFSQAVLLAKFFDRIRADSRVGFEKGEEISWNQRRQEKGYRDGQKRDCGELQSPSEKKRMDTHGCRIGD